MSARARWVSSVPTLRESAGVWAEGWDEEVGLLGSSPSTSKTDQRLCTQPPFHTVAGLPRFALKLNNVSPEPGRVCLTEAGLYIYETLCCRGDSIACTAAHPHSPLNFAVSYPTV